MQGKSNAVPQFIVTATIRVDAFSHEYIENAQTFIRLATSAFGCFIR